MAIGCLPEDANTTPVHRHRIGSVGVRSCYRIYHEVGAAYWTATRVGKGFWYYNVRAFLMVDVRTACVRAHAGTRVLQPIEDCCLK